MLRKGRGSRTRKWRFPGDSYLIEVLKKTQKSAACFLLLFLLSTVEICFSDFLEIFDYILLHCLFLKIMQTSLRQEFYILLIIQQFK